MRTTEQRPRQRLMAVIGSRPIAGLAARRPAIVSGRFDVQLVIYALLLALAGLATAYSSTGDSAVTAGSTFTRGLVWLALASLVFIVTSAFDYRWLRTFAWPLYIVDLSLLVTSLLFGSGVGGVARWVTVLGIPFQFSEIAKVLTIVVLASFLVSRRERLGDASTVLGAAVLVAPCLALVLVQPDLGTSLVFGAILFGTLFLAGARVRWLALLAAAAAASVPLAWSMLLRDYQKERLLAFLDPTADPQGAGFHLLVSQDAVASGGFTGVGLGGGAASAIAALPVQTTDFAFAVLSHRLGFVGAVVVLGLFACLISRVLVIGWRSADRFGLCFAAGVASMVLFQVLVNAGMVLGIMPVTGIPLPFITHGGASLISLAVALGTLESISLRNARQ